ncbi:MAG: hypothetical protein ACFBSG_13760 [Leptolyngbyaceae cyanobacterium]
MRASSTDDDWETLPFMGLPPLSPPDSAPLPTPVTSQPSPVTELQTRIADLNQCNEVLLARVHQLEEALERSQQTLQQEVERSQRLTAEDKIVAAQSRSMAQLLSELDQSNTALERQTLLADTLAAQLKTTEDRAQQLEKECAILRKRKAERAKQLQTAEETCVDLRSRLQRQQQYTLQFKAALEKCLDTSTFQQTSQTIEHNAEDAAGAISAVPSPTNSVGMPRSASIKPWSGNQHLSTDPQLQTLMRFAPDTAPQTQPEATESSPNSPLGQPEAAISEPLDSLDDDCPGDRQDSRTAEQQLWQDVERVVEITTVPEEPETISTSVSPATEAVPEPEATASVSEFTEPIPWGTPVKPKGHVEVTPSDADELPTPSSPQPEAAPLTEDAAIPAEADTTDPAATTAAYIASDLPRIESQNRIAAMEAMAAAPKSPSPLVNPLRPAQRKRQSLSAVELPSFPPLPKVETDV